MSRMKPIRTNEDYEAALFRIEELFGSAPGSSGSDEAEVLTMLISDYEDRRYNILPPDPIEAIKFRLEQIGLNQEQAAKRLDVTSGRLSEFLRRRRKMPAQFLIKVKTRLGVPADCLLPDESSASKQPKEAESEDEGRR